ncbi:MAG TPA: arginine deiminase family protein [Hyphomonadaceae bacterium]|jgi:dimethylargininase|nr:arginine deiminase family protein [Hyphomonadaceae bacterium]
MFSHALLRLPGENLASGLTDANEGAPDVAIALAQHQGYCEALADCGLSLTVLPADARYPDGCFVEDTAIVTPRGAIITRPGAPSRRGEVDVIAAALQGLFPRIPRIEAPSTVDAGDVCEADGHFLIGLSARTNEAGAHALEAHLIDLGYRSDIIDIRQVRSLLHLKTGIAYLGEGRMLATADVPRARALAAYEVVEVPHEERYAANALRVNERVLVAGGYPRTREAIESLGFQTVAVEMSEYRKLDGGLSCLSLRWQ